MKRRSKIVISTLIAAVLSGIYWLGFFFFAEAFTAADYRSDARPSEAYLTFKVAIAFVSGPLIFAVLIAVWRSIEGSFSNENDA